MKTYKVKFIGRQVRAIGIFYEIRDTYKVKNLGQLLHCLYTDYECIKGLTVWEDKSEPFKYREPIEIKDSVLENTKIIPFRYPRRETSPKTGTYKYTRSDAPVNYNY